MPRTLSVKKIIKQLRGLSTEQLLEVRENVNALIEKAPASSWRTIDVQKLNLRKSVTFTSLPQGVPIERWDESKIKSYSISPKVLSSEALTNLLPYSLSVPTYLKNESPKNESLDDAIKLVEEWMSDESGYDEETYPQIEAALNEN
jgi:hypothetical protein